MSVSGIILAAGRGTRFTNGSKLVATLDGVAVIRRVALALAASRVVDLFIVVRPGDTATRDALGDGRWRCVENASFETGMASSVRKGIVALSPSASGALIALSDMPLIEAAFVDRLIEAFDVGDRKRIVFPQDADGRQGHPVIWPRDLFDPLTQLTGDRGARDLLAHNRERCDPVRVAGAAAFADVDTVDDLEALISARQVNRRT